MFCITMFAILESLVKNLSAWCSGRYSTMTKCWILISLVLLVYVMVIFIAKTSVGICRYFEKGLFEELYRAVEKNDVLRSIFILDNHPYLINRFKYPGGYTPFMIACANANTQLVKYMLKKGADVNLKSESNETPFYLAAFYYVQNTDCKNATCIRELYYGGANINEPCKNNLTVLQMAAVFGHTSLVKWLLMKNANLKICPHPYLLARSQGHQEAANFIANSMKTRCIKFK